jgi:hypothetical protein
MDIPATPQHATRHPNFVSPGRYQLYQDRCSKHTHCPNDTPDRNKKYEITCATDDLIVALIGYFPSFSLYLAGAEWKMHHAKTIKTEEILHKLMFGILVKHAAGFGFVHGCKPTINNKLVLPNDHDFNWSRYVRPESSQRPRMLQFDYRL